MPPASASPRGWPSGPRRRCPSSSTTGSRASSALNNRSNAPARRIQSRATERWITTQEVPSGPTRVERRPMEEGTMSILQIWRALQGRCRVLAGWPTRPPVKEGIRCKCMHCTFFASLFFSYHKRRQHFERSTPSRRQSSVQQSSSSSYSQQQQHSGQQSWQQASGSFNARQVKMF